MISQQLATKNAAPTQSPHVCALHFVAGHLAEHSKAQCACKIHNNQCIRILTAQIPATVEPCYGPTMLEFKGPPNHQAKSRRRLSIHPRTLGFPPKVTIDVERLQKKTHTILELNPGGVVNTCLLDKPCWGGDPWPNRPAILCNTFSR